MSSLDHFYFFLSRSLHLFVRLTVKYPSHYSSLDRWVCIHQNTQLAPNSVDPIPLIVEGFKVTVSELGQWGMLRVCQAMILDVPGRCMD